MDQVDDILERLEVQPVDMKEGWIMMRQRMDKGSASYIIFKCWKTAAKYDKTDCAFQVERKRVTTAKMKEKLS